MVVLVRCIDNTYAPALESRLNDLVGKGIIAAFLSNGKWVEVAHKQDEEYEPAAAKRHLPRMSQLAVCY